MPSVQAFYGFRCQVSGVSNKRVLIGFRLKVNGGERESNSSATPIQWVGFRC
ncbi:hypothetical protein D1AOALGA4SA_800 [Olavius algarvensis Delta 1 endosymbiont]|nr:hypothetical protein D1AOALGA4SA_800 [Olavius algarvensis Delta 1 endosymbiont]